jgi:hypothetical protein
MNTKNATFSAEAFFRESKKRALVQAFFRPESAIILALAVLLVGLCVLRIFWFPWMWWVWALFGIIGVGLIVFTSMKDEKFVQQVSVTYFYERFDKSKLRLPELQQHVTEALEFHRQLFQEIARRPYAPLGDVASDMDRLVAGIYYLAKSLDSFVSNEQIKRYLLDLLREAESHANERGYTIEEYANALITLRDARRAANGFTGEAALLETVSDTVSEARIEIQDTLKNISAVHRRISVSATNGNNTQADWGFVDVVRDSFDDHLHSLTEKTSAMDALYRSCEVAAQLRARTKAAR